MTYFVTVGWNGFLGCTEEYEVDADNEYEARELALEMAGDDLSIEDVKVEED